MAAMEGISRAELEAAVAAILSSVCYLGMAPVTARRFGETAEDVATAQRELVRIGIDRPEAVRAVARANGANQVAVIIPCHRVLAAGQRLGGFSAYGGIVTKRELLAIEGADGFSDPTLF